MGEDGKKRKANFIKIILILCAILITCILVGFHIINESSKQKQINSFVPDNVRQSVDFPLFIPATDEFKPKSQSFSYSNGTLLFQGTYKNEEYTFTEQQKPKDFDLNKFSAGQGITGAQLSTSKHGQTLLGTVLGRPRLIIRTDSTIITVTGQPNASTANLEALPEALIEVKPE